MAYDGVTQADVDFALAVAAKVCRRVPAFLDEAESAALVGLARAAKGFDPTKGVAFRTYAAMTIRHAIQDAMREWQVGGRKWDDRPTLHSLDAPADGEGGESFASSVASGEEEVGWEAEYQDEIAGLAKRLPKCQQAAFATLFTNAATANCVRAAEALGISESTVSLIIGKSVTALRERFVSPGEMFMTGGIAMTNGTATRCPTHDTPLNAFGICRDCVSGEMDHHTEPEPTPEPRAKSCPDCGGPLAADRNRCYRCKPGGLPAVRAKAAPAPAPPRAVHPEPEPPAPVVRPRVFDPAPAAIDPEVRAISRCLDALAGLDKSQVGRVMGYLALRHPA